MVSFLSRTVELRNSAIVIFRFKEVSSILRLRQVLLYRYLLGLLSD